MRKVTDSVEELSEFHKSEIQKIQIELKKLQSVNKVQVGNKKEHRGKEFYPRRILDKVHTPKDTIDMLHKFQTRDDQYKWFTHKPTDTNQVFDCLVYMKNAQSKLKKFIITDANLQSLSHIQFIAGDEDKRARNEWSKEYKVKFNWSLVKDWAKNNPEKHPYDEYIEIDGDLKLWENCMKEFKNSIVFQSSNSLSKRIKESIIHNLDLDIEYSRNFEENGGKKLYTHCSLILDSINQIISWCSDHKEKSARVFFDIQDNENSISIEIVHVGSWLNDDFIEEDKYKGIDGNFKSTRIALFSLADWSIQAPVENALNKTLNLVCLDNSTSYNSKLKTISEIKKDWRDVKSEGVKHILTLYKTNILE